MSSAMARKVETLEKRVETLERQIKDVARTATTTALFVNAIIKHTGIKNADLQEALVQAGMEHAAAQLFRSEGAGTAGRDSGNRDGVVPPAAGDGRDPSSPAGQQQGNAGGQQPPSANGDLPSGNGSAPVGGGAESGTSAEGSEASKDPAGG